MKTDNDGGPAVRRLDMGTILVVEDSQEDAEAIQRALSRSHPMLRLEFVDRGEGVADRLLAAETPPGIVLLDLNMPGMSGHDVLTAVRAHPGLSAVRIVVFTTSTAPAEEDACHAAGADSYVYKPLNFDLFRTVLTGAVDYWLRPSG
ncbi:response regulator [Streptomyces sp. cg28]|uniref:response regulator n=1 Tax=unclassified Streptomyces TaxID=2593676 RepID=UPI000DBA3384|nr:MULTISPECIES: response regulator [unclassified Streptomyces]MYT71872.1 response regulator [Streptomyces sp. SID8367]RAJ75252.1 CheY-like chemotaxis protein [Streptomyces sp. PsTaAH-137]